MEKDFNIIDHTADVGIVAYGADIEQAFANAARGLFSLITELNEVQEALSRKIKLRATDEESLLVEWLNQLIYLFDTENTIFNRFDIIQLNPTSLRAKAYGEKVDRARHRLKTGIKAASYHMLSIDKGDVCQVQVILDI